MHHPEQWKKPKTKMPGISKARGSTEYNFQFRRVSHIPQVNKALGLAYWQTEGLRVCARE